jgi:hypothetical protein
VSVRLTRTGAASVDKGDVAAVAYEIRDDGGNVRRIGRSSLVINNLRDGRDDAWFYLSFKELISDCF